MKITIYTITDCQFSKQEKEYLNLHKLPFEEKNLETNREFLTEMLAVSNNFAGTPVTKIDKDDGQIAVLKGFTQADFDKLLGFGTPEAKPEEKKADAAAPVKDEAATGMVKPTEAPVNPPLPQKAESKPQAPASDAVAPAQAAPVATPPPVTASTDPLANVLNTLQEQAAQPASPQAPAANPVASTQAVPPVQGGMPVIPDPQL